MSDFLDSRPFGAIIKPIFDSMSIRPIADNARIMPTANNEPTDPTSIFEPRPTTSESDSESLIRWADLFVSQS